LLDLSRIELRFLLLLVEQIVKLVIDGSPMLPARDATHFQLALQRKLLIIQTVLNLNTQQVSGAGRRRTEGTSGRRLQHLKNSSTAETTMTSAKMTTKAMNCASMAAAQRLGSAPNSVHHA
jgi:hypothetical protein